MQARTIGRGALPLEATLAFLATGGPSDAPSLSLLDGMPLTAAVPEPATWGVLAMGLAGLTAFQVGRHRRG